VDCPLVVRKQQANAEELRIRGLLSDALGSPGERIGLANSLGRVSGAVRQRAAQSADPNYFASASPTGLTRLRDHLQENAFWNKSMYAAAARQYSAMLASFAVAALVIVLVALPLVPDAAVFARYFVAVLVLVRRLLRSMRSFGGEPQFRSPRLPASPPLRPTHRNTS
jgi:hypothetical protein